MAPRRRARFARALLAVLFLLSGATLWVTLPPADSASSVVMPDVRDRVLREGRVRVIAELRLPAGSHVPEGLLTAAAQTVQRRDIAGVRLQILSRLAGRSHRVLHQYSTVPLVALDVGPDALTELEASSLWVRRVVVDSLNAPTLAQSVPLIGGDVAWSRGFDGTGVVVAIVDTGVEATHPFLTGKVVEEACYSSNVSGHSITMCPNGSTQQTGPGSGASCPLSVCWHGTHVAGIAAGNGAGAGVAFSGVAKGAQIMAVQVFSKFTNASDCGGSPPCALAWTSDIIAGLERVYSLRGARNFSSANLSIGGGSYTAPCDSDPAKSIIDNLRSVGIATAVAAGNNGYTNALSSPGCISSAISVGATTKSDVVASFSNSAPFLSLFAPGVSIYSSVTGGGFGYASGTSMATPHVTGTWGVLKQAAPSASVTQILTALQTTGLLITDSDSGVTKPRIRIDQALGVLVPTATSISPTQGTAGAAVAVTIAGSGFATGATVSAGAGITVSNISIVSAVQLTATLTIAVGASPGGRDVSVINPGGGTGTLVGGFTVAGAGVAVTSIAPNQGTQGTTVPVTINGSGFAAGATVSLSGAGIGVTNVTVGSAMQLTATLTVASGAALGARDVTVTNSGGASATLTGGFTVIAPVTIGSIVPSQGAQGASVPVTINGSGFAAGATVSLSATGISVTNVVVGSAAQLTATLGIAAGATLGVRDVTVTNSGGGSGTLTGGFTVVVPVTVTSVTPNQGAVGATVPVTIAGSGFVTGATVSVGAGITVSNVSVGSATQITATLSLAAGAALGQRNVTVTNTGGTSGTLAGGFTVTSASAATLSLAYNGKLRDRVGQGSTALGADGALDGTVTATLSAPGGRTITALRLDSDQVGAWDTDASSGWWVLGVAPSLDGALLNAAGTMAVSFAVADGGSFVVFASDYQSMEFLSGRTLVLKATFSDGTTATGTTTVAAGTATVSAVTPNQGAQGASVPVTITGSGFVAGASVSVSGTGVTVSNVAVGSAAQLTATLGLAAGATLGARDVTVTNSGGGSGMLAGGFTVTSASAATLSLAYNGKLRDRVGQGNTALGADGALDGTLTATLSAPGGRTITALRLDSDQGVGTWDTDASSMWWALGVATSLDGALLNAAGTMAVNFAVADGGSFVVFASDYQSMEFLSGRTLVLKATFSDGTTATASTIVP